MRPGLMQLADVIGIDLVERTVVPRLEAAVVAHPVVWIFVGVQQAIPRDIGRECRRHSTEHRGCNRPPDQSFLSRSHVLCPPSFCTTPMSRTPMGSRWIRIVLGNREFCLVKRAFC